LLRANSGWIKDYKYGYLYPVIIENAAITKE
jgi:hypothetical protein